MPTIIAAFLAPIISFVSLYAAHKSYTAITNLQQYEERSEHAAKYSETAAQQLHKTRVTQGSSAVAIALSAASSSALIIRPILTASSESTWVLVLSPLNVVAIAAAFFHNRGFWKAKAKVPFVEGFNEGIQKSKEIRDLLMILGGAWTAVGLVGWL